MTTLYRRATEPVLSAENVLSRFEEGKPADPTENMSPEDKAEWEKQNDLHKDEFKSAGKIAAVDKAKVKKWMKSMVDDHVDNKTGEVNTTSLAESAAHEFDQDQWLDDENHWVWDLSFDVANGYERANKQASMNVATRFLTAGQDKQAPEQVDKYFKEVKEGNPSYSDSQAYATAWSIYCKHKNPGSDSCHQDEYLTGKTAGGREWKRGRRMTLAGVSKTASSPQELHEMRELMEGEGYDPDDAKNLQDEGMGAHELEHIFRTTRPGGMGSLEYTHGIRRLKTAGFRTAAPRKPKSLPEKKDLQLLIDRLKRNPKDGDVERSLRGDWDYKDADIEKIKA